MDYTPEPVASWLASLPDQNIGKIYARIRPPFWPFAPEFKVDGWGQICDGQDHRDMVHLMLYNKFPNHGKGWTYISWRAVPDHPEKNNYPREGKVMNPRPYGGVGRQP